jgi:putative addiction module component (TIGR02574 family)
MARTYDEILKDALTLTEDERVELMEALDYSRLSPEEREARAEWDAEIARRIAEIEAGTAKLIPAEEAVAKARAKVREVSRAARRG